MSHLFSFLNKRVVLSQIQKGMEISLIVCALGNKSDNVLGGNWEGVQARSAASAGAPLFQYYLKEATTMRHAKKPRDKRPAKARKSGPRSTAPSPAAPAKSFPVAGIGASAGGLEAFTALLNHLPVDTGMAFVVVQHLSPTHDGILPKLLGKTTGMPVLEVTHGMTVEPNHVYVIPPNANMEIAGGVLKLLPREITRGQARSIDFFFQSLAEARGHESIGIILSGTASDGTIGLEAIKAEGGITFAQDESAKFDSMPRSAIAAGCVDFVLSPAAIARELARLARHPYVITPKRAPVEEGEVEPGEDLKRVLTVVRRHSGNDFNAYKCATLQRRLHRRMVLGKFKDLSDYVVYLETHPAEVESLTADFLIGVTNFFRDPDAFEFVKKKVFPKLLKARQSRPMEEALRFWVLGCSTGQEAYSLAMAWLEFAESARANVMLQIFATDVHNPYLERARSGVYSKSLLQDVSPERLRRFFVEVDGGYRVSKAIRDMCVFAKQNVVSDPPFSHIDLVSCRNLLIYLRAEQQRRVIPIFHFALKPGGFLFLGPAENVTGFGHMFLPTDRKVKVFARKPGPSQITARFSPNPLPPIRIREAVASSPPAETGQDALREADRLLLSKYAPVGVLINADLQVLQFRGYTGRYLEAPPGKATLNVLKMAREGLLSPLRNAIKRAVKQNATVKTPGVIVQEENRTVTINLEVIPLKHSREEQRCFLITFEPVPEMASEPALKKKPGASPPAHKGSEGDTAQVRRELAETKEHLQSVIEQQDAYNEELQSANEEAQAANEELQSINEELETAKEELQASNEELTTVNEELHTRNHEMALTTGDLTNLLTSVNMAIVMLGRDLCIRRFTAQAEKVLHIVASDVGRPITDLALNFPIVDLEHSLTQVIQTVTFKEQEVQDRQGHWYALRIRPYLTSDNKIDGAVMLLVDVDELKRNQMEIAEARDYAQHIVETVGDALLVLDHTLIVQSANQSFYELFRVSPQETEKRYLYSLGSGEWNVPDLRRLLEEMLPQNRSIKDFEVEQEFPRLGHRIMRLNARRFTTSASNRELILLAITDVSDARIAEKKLHRSELRYRRLFEAAKDGILILDAATGKISDVNPYMVELLNYSRKELLGKELWEIGLIRDRRDSETTVRKLQESETVRYEDLPLESKDGRTKEVEMFANLYREDGHDVIQCNIRNITERKTAERELAERARLLDLSNDAIIVRDRDNRISLWNQGAEKMYGWKAEEVMGKDLHTLLHTEFPHPYKEILAELDREGCYRGEVVQVARNGRRVPSACRWVLDFKTRSILTSYTDVTERKEQEEAQKVFTQQLATDLEDTRQLQQISAQLIHEDNVELLYGQILDAAIAITRSDMGSLQMFYPDRDALRLLAWKGFDPESARLWEWVGTDKGCSCGEALRTGLRVIVSDTEKCDFLLEESLAAFRKLGLRSLQSTPLISRAGKTVGIISTHWHKTHELNERELRILDVLARQAADLIERKDSEEALRKAQVQLADRAGQLERLVAERTARLQETVQELESYSYSIAHDMRAPLRTMSSFARLIQTEHGTQLDEAGQGYLERVITASQRLDHLVTDVLNYSSASRREMHLRPVNLEKLLDEAIRNQGEFQSPRAVIDIRRPLPPVIAHEPSLMQVVNNLFSNAVKFVLPGVLPRVTVRSELKGEDVRVWFEDNGIGISKEDVERIFALFGRLHPAAEFEGTGIGLTIVRKAVERMGGKVGVESEPGKGSQFWIQLRKAKTDEPNDPSGGR